MDTGSLLCLTGACGRGLAASRQLFVLHLEVQSCGSLEKFCFRFLRKCQAMLYLQPRHSQAGFPALWPAVPVLLVFLVAVPVMDVHHDLSLLPTLSSLKTAS